MAAALRPLPPPARPASPPGLPAPACPPNACARPHPNHPQPSNRRWASEERIISNKTIKYMSTKWAYATDGDVSATPAVANGKVYFPTWGGSLVALDASTGAVAWSVKVEALLTAAGVTIDASDVGYIVSRSGPAYGTAGARNLVIIGTMRCGAVQAGGLGGHGYPVCVREMAVCGRCLYPVAPLWSRFTSASPPPKPAGLPSTPPLPAPPGATSAAILT